MPSPCRCGVYECAAQSLAGVVRVHRDLLDVGGVVDEVEEEVGDGPVDGVGGYPRPPGTLVAEQLEVWEGLVVCDGRHADDGAEGCTSSALDAGEEGNVVDVGSADHGGITSGESGQRPLPGDEGTSRS